MAWNPIKLISLPNAGFDNSDKTCIRRFLTWPKSCKIINFTHYHDFELIFSTINKTHASLSVHFLWSGLKMFNWKLETLPAGARNSCLTEQEGKSLSQSEVFVRFNGIFLVIKAAILVQLGEWI